MKKIAGLVGNLLSTKTGLLSVIAEKTGKISLRRSTAVMALTLVVVPAFAIDGLTWEIIALIGIILGSVAVTEIFKKS